jgi:molybdopterin/thiamine biosynthesis adenylyltransferase
MIDYINAMERHLGMWGVEGQEKIRQAHVAVGGVGGIGAISALMLAKAGVGKISICDRDSYGIENIVEQIFATYDTIGEEKVIAAKREMLRHNQFAEINAFTGDLSDESTAMKLIEDADILVSGVDNAAARIMLGKVCAKKRIPFVVSANIGWSILHTVYLPTKNHYGSIWRDVDGLKWSEDFPDMTDPITCEKVEKEWNIWVVALSRFEQDSLKQFITKKTAYYWYAAPQAYFAASLGITDALKIMVEKGEVFSFPNIFYFDMKSSKVLSWEELCMRRSALREIWDTDIESILNLSNSWQ